MEAQTLAEGEDGRRVDEDEERGEGLFEWRLQAWAVQVRAKEGGERWQGSRGGWIQRAQRSAEARWVVRGKGIQGAQGRWPTGVPEREKGGEGQRWVRRVRQRC